MVTERGKKYRSKRFFDVLFYKKEARAKYIYYICNQSVNTPDDFQSTFHQNKD